MMKKLQESSRHLQFSLAFLLLIISWANASFHNHHHDHNEPEAEFLDCLLKSKDTTISSIIYTPHNSSFSSVLNFYVRNLRYLSPKTPKPRVILIPVKESQVQLAVTCGKTSGLQVRIRSGGHDFEGSSYISLVPFFILDLVNFRSISVDAHSMTAWVGAGATLGEIYYKIYHVNSTFGFSAGNWPTVAAGGHISGGGYGPLTRQYGLAADNVIDAVVVDVNGTIRDRKSMGEDLFWAIRGGVGCNFVVILSYKLLLSYVPTNVTTFLVTRTLEQNAIQLVHKWQYVTPELPITLTSAVRLRSDISNETGNATISARFLSVYRGGVDELLSIMGQYFPELGLTREDCHEMLWIQYYLFQVEHPLDDVANYLTSRVSPQDQYFTAKADFPREPFPVEGIEAMLYKLLEVPPLVGQMEWTTFAGGIMDEIPESQIPFPHRGSVFVMFEVAFWNESSSSAVIRRYTNWLRELRDIIGKYVPNNPRPAYADYRDLDLGVNNIVGETSIEQARKWGGPYFKDNFDKLVRVKSQVDPENYFKNEQSFPPLPPSSPYYY